MDAVALLPEPDELYRWTADEFMALISAGLIEEAHGIELMDGIIERTMSQGPFHRFTYAALLRALSALGALERGVESMPPVVLGQRNAIEPDFALLSPSIAGKFGIPRDGDLLWAIEVSDATLAKDLGRKKRAYAQAGIPHYWVFDAHRRGVWVFSRPLGVSYADERFVPAGNAIEMPILGGLLDTGPLFPAD